jgi:hypothetical protein
VIDQHLLVQRHADAPDHGAAGDRRD